MRQRRFIRSVALAVTVSALAAPAAMGQGNEGGASSAMSTEGMAAPSQRQDLRSPDTRDAAEGRGTFNAPSVTVIKVPEPESSAGGGINWGDAGIGAVGLLAIILVAGVGVVAVVHHRRGTPPRTAIAG